MKQKVGIIGLLAFFVVIMVSLFAQAQSVNPQETLNQHIAELQKNPNDNSLREKIIKHVRTMKPAPAVPKEAERYMTRGIAAMKDAKSADDFKDAVKEFEKASLSAPWFANAYYNLGIAQDKAGLYAKAIKSLNLYLIAAPEAPDVKTVEKLIYEVEYRQEKAQKESSPKTVAEKEKKKFEEWLKKLDGARYVRHFSNDLLNSDLIIEIKGNEIFESEVYTWLSPVLVKSAYPVKVGVQYPGDRYTITGKEFTPPQWKGGECNYVMRISEDTITFNMDCPTGERFEHIYKREK